MIQFGLLAFVCFAASEAGNAGYGYDQAYGYGDYNHGVLHGDVLANGQNYEVNYSGPKANPIVAKYAPSSYGYVSEKAHGYGDYSYGGIAHGDALANGQNYEMNYSGPKANPIVAKYSPSSYGYGSEKAYGFGDYGYGGDAHGDVLANGQNYEVNYSGPKANPIVAKYAPSTYGHDIVYGGYGRYGHGSVSNARHGYAVPKYGYADNSYGYKGYGYSQQLPTIGGSSYVEHSKPTGFLYKNARYIGHGSPYVPYTAGYKKTYKKISGYSD